MTPKLILHIGTHKTASTTLQVLMARYRAQLAEQGILYADPSQGPRPNKSKHASLTAALAQGPEAAAAECDRLIREFEASGCHTLVLSHERLSSANQKQMSTIESLQPLRDRFDTRVVGIFRRQDTFVESLWNQHAKTNVTDKPIEAYLNARPMQQHINYFDTLNTWSQFGPVTALGFEANKDTGIVAAFSEATGIPLSDPPKNANISPSMTCAAIMIRLKRAGIAYDWHDVEVALNGRGRRHALGSRLRRALLEQMAESNARLAAEYGIEFPDDMPEEDEEPLKVPTMAEARALTGFRFRIFANSANG